MARRRPGRTASMTSRWVPTTSIVRVFLFGCAHADRGSTFNFDVSGTLALGGGAQSFVQQTATQYGRVFSYCIPPSPSSLGFITLGVPPQRAALVPTFVSTPLLSSSSMPPTFYRVLLRAIIVAGRPLPVPPTLCDRLHHRHLAARRSGGR
uniref:Xylanase inhibitor N-terminal domain-containing protein n=1 Tax=Oryza glumipatula TaxID=40148 RepID=A0A0E0A4A2_9ORYZ